ncbi:50S ribosomal subunit protein L29 [Desulfamplus magnetovallimortis]|uniref:Large ribosomal subunit protein uL29 n=1 Tax=Desulfamplus magnetovallimortis TaxID=1246637 RepID=A0A1W1H5P5_9BACT|nr:50S ribosomal protein L29 [Desulfamplus magnetovallimortis]SLM27772.1 50S ribosomal subunit protein L29 [Desulfamplus magnetovallimortis]
MKTSEIKAMSAEEITIKLAELKKEFFNLRFQHGAGQLENTAVLPKIRKDIARLMTVSREMNLTIS